MSSALNTLLEQAERERDAGLARLAAAEQRLQHATLQLQQLQAYREDTRRRAPTAAGQATDITSLRTHQHFLLRLDQAVDQATLQEAQAQAQVQNAHRALLPLELRVASVRKLLDRRASAAQQASDRRDQRQTDEAALQRHVRAGTHANALPSAL